MLFIFASKCLFVCVTMWGSQQVFFSFWRNSGNDGAEVTSLQWYATCQTNVKGQIVTYQKDFLIHRLNCHDIVTLHSCFFLRHVQPYKGYSNKHQIKSQYTNDAWWRVWYAKICMSRSWNVNMRARPSVDISTEGQIYLHVTRVHHTSFVLSHHWLKFDQTVSKTYILLARNNTIIRHSNYVTI